MREIHLTNGGAAIVDESDYEIVSMFSWRYFRPSRSHTGYAIRYERVDGSVRAILMHRFILGLQHGDARRVDHKDHDGLNNTRDNLRFCNHTQNIRNQRIRETGKTSPYKGVWVGRDNRIHAGIKINGRSINLGVFQDHESAARAYDDTAIKEFGKFAFTNFQGQ